jgi:hypothetical protein
MQRFAELMRSAGAAGRGSGFSNHRSAMQLKIYEIKYLNRVDAIISEGCRTGRPLETTHTARDAV